MVYTDTRKTLEILEALVAFDTTSYRSNLDLIDYISGYLAEFGISSHRIFNEEKSKANLLATIGSGDRGGILLSGHTDVVPVTGQDWVTDPFKLSIAEGRAYGRGTCDMKGFIACALAAVPDMCRANLAVPIHFAFSYDEEIGCAGVGSMINLMKSNGLNIEACIIGEPSSMKPVTAHTGKSVFKCQFYGTPMHSSLAPEGVNAIAFAGDVIHHLNSLEQAAKSFTITDERFKHPHPTLNIGKISGGKAVNIVAEYCEFDVEYRYPPGSEADYLLNQLPEIIRTAAHEPMNAKSPSASASCQQTVAYPAFKSDFNSPASLFARRLTGSNTDIAVNYGTEAGLFQQSGYSSVVCGPGSIEQAHQPNEFIDLSELSKCDAFMSALIAELSLVEVG
ncbi:MAG: acetylornithine deacetylase [Sneathiella sp.]|nr:acetylornithine deacetylase [Sneathiella sp.]